MRGERAGTCPAAWAWLLAGLLALPAAARDAIRVGQPAPDFALPTLAHGNVRLSGHRGEVVALLFWASWCGDCRRELERWERLAKRHGADGLVVLGVNLDRDADAAAAAALAGAANISYPTLLDPGQRVARRYDPDVLPMLVLVDRGGTLRALAGALKGDAEESLLAVIDGLLDE